MPTIYRDKRLSDLDITKDEIGDKGCDLYPGSTIMVLTASGLTVWIHRGLDDWDIYCGSTNVMEDASRCNELGEYEEED